jgi:predicted phage terminase large subunit-like protein
LGREPGEFLQSARGRTTEQWEAIKVRAGSRTWQALYQGRPSAAEGTIFKRTLWQQYDQAPWIVRDDGSHIVTNYDELIASWDMTFKDTDGSDLVAGQIWMRRGADAYLLDQVNRRMDFVETCAAVRALAAKWPQAILKLVEDKANGTAVMSSLARVVPGMVPVEPDGGKVARAVAVSPLVEAGNVWIPVPELEGCAWVGAFIEEAAGFPTATHDDQVDAMTQALNRLILQPLLASGDTYDETDLDDELAEFTITPY